MICRSTLVFTVLVTACAPSLQARLPETDDGWRQRSREVLAEVIGTNTSTEVGCGVLAEHLAARFLDGGFAAADVQLLGPSKAHQNLVVRVRGDPGSGVKPVLFFAHLDVVPARRADWSTDPYTLVEKDGFFFGRGVQDMKEEVAEIVTNLLRLKHEGFVPRRDLIVAFTDDEEGGAANGIEWLLAHHRALIDAELAINLEGGGGDLIKGQHAVLEVQRAEKRYFTVALEARSPGGHSSIPPPAQENAIYRLAHALEKVGAFEFPLRTDELTRAFFTTTAKRETGEHARDLLGAGASPMDEAAAARVAASSTYFNAMLRTTCVATMLEAGHAENALPQTARALVNCRLLPGDTPDAIEAALRGAIADPSITLSRETTHLLSPMTVESPEVSVAVTQVAHELWPAVVVTPVMSTGASDGRYLRAAGIPVYGVSGMFLDIDDVRAHGKDENLGVVAYDEGVEFMRRFLRAFLGPKTSDPK